MYDIERELHGVIRKFENGDIEAEQKILKQAEKELGIFFKVWYILLKLKNNNFNDLKDLK